MLLTQTVGFEPRVFGSRVPTLYQLSHPGHPGSHVSRKKKKKKKKKVEVDQVSVRAPPPLPPTFHQWGGAGTPRGVRQDTHWYQHGATCRLLLRL